MTTITVVTAFIWTIVALSSSPQILSYLAGVEAILPERWWENPCSGSTLSDVLFLYQSRQTNYELEIESLFEKIQQAVVLCDTVTTAIAGTYESRRAKICGTHFQYGLYATTVGPLLSTSVIGELQDPRLSESVLGFPDTNSVYSPGMTIDELLDYEIKRVSGIGMFLDQAKRTTPVYVDEIRSLERKCREILCQMHGILRGQDVTSSVPPPITYLESSAQINERNYLIIRDSKKIFEAITSELGDYVLYLLRT